MTTHNTVTVSDSDKMSARASTERYETRRYSSGGCYKATNTYFTLIKRADNDRTNDGIRRLEHKHRESLAENPYYKKTVELKAKKKELTKLERDIKALHIMLNEKTPDDELYEDELTILKQKYKKHAKLQKEYDKKAKELKESLYER
jgi:hypothetical protein